MAYNFLLMSHLEHAAFVDVMQPANTILTPLLGDYVPYYFPIVLIVFVVFNVFNLYTKFLQTFCVKRLQRFVFDEDFSDEKIDVGRKIIERGFF